MHIQDIVSVGQRVIKIKGLRIAVLAVERIRTALLLVAAAISFCMLAVLSAFTLVTHLAWRSVDGISPYDGVSILCFGLLVLAGGLFWVAMSPKRWMRALGVEALVTALGKEKSEGPAEKPSSAPASEISTEDLAELIDRIVQKRVRQELQKTEGVAAASTKPETETRPRVAS